MLGTHGKSIHVLPLSHIEVRTVSCLVRHGCSSKQAELPVVARVFMSATESCCGQDSIMSCLMGKTMDAATKKLCYIIFMPATETC
jgi:hypothetical protein